MMKQQTDGCLEPFKLNKMKEKTIKIPTLLVDEINKINQQIIEAQEQQKKLNNLILIKSATAQGIIKSVLVTNKIGENVKIKFSEDNTQIIVCKE